MTPNRETKKEILPILKYGNPLLRKKVANVTDFSELPQFVELMLLTMREEGGIGLAANQVGRSINLLVVDTHNVDKKECKTYIFINSKIIKTEGLILMEEGCLSVPDIRAEIERPKIITIQYQDLEQTFHENIFDGITSRVIQHELDHLYGKFFVDYLSPSNRLLIHKRLLEISKNGKPLSEIIL